MAQKEGNGLILYSASGLTARAHARELLTLAVREVWGLSPLPEIAQREGGKPFFPDREELHFNLSHSGDLALCGLDRAPVGVDIQIVKAWRLARLHPPLDPEGGPGQGERPGADHLHPGYPGPPPGTGTAGNGRAPLPDLDRPRLDGGSVRTQRTAGKNF